MCTQYNIIGPQPVAIPVSVVEILWAKGGVTSTVEVDGMHIVVLTPLHCLV